MGTWELKHGKLQFPRSDDVSTKFYTITHVFLLHLRLQYKYSKTKNKSAVKEPGHFEVRKSSRQVIRSRDRSQDFLWGVLFFSKKSWTFLVLALKTQAANAADCFTVKIKQISGQIW